MEKALNIQSDRREMLKAKLEYIEMLEHQGYIYTVGSNTVSICDQDNNPVYITEFVTADDKITGKSYHSVVVDEYYRPNQEKTK